MKYVRIDSDRIVREIIPEFEETFPNVPITKRYSKEYLSQCLEVSDSVAVEQNWDFLPIENAFKKWIEYTGETGKLVKTRENVIFALSCDCDGVFYQGEQSLENDILSVDFSDLKMGQNKFEIIFIATDGRKMTKTLYVEVQEEQLLI